MNMYHRNVVLLLAVAGVLLCAGSVQSGVAPLRPGDAMPSLNEFDLEGKLPVVAGKVVLIDFWASWCGPCKSSFAVMENLRNKFSVKGLEIIAVNVDVEASGMNRFLKKYKASFTVVRDLNRRLVGHVGVEMMPTSYLVDRAGKIRFVHRGFFGKKTAEKYEEEICKLLGELL